MEDPWLVTTEIVNPETGLRKVYATRTDDTNPENIIAQMFFVKARMKTPEEKKAVWDNLYQQYLDSIKVVSDPVAKEGKTYLDAKEVP